MNRVTIALEAGMRVADMPHILEQQLAHAAVREAWMEVQRCWLERKSLPLFRRWLDEWKTRKEKNYRLINQALPSKPLIQVAHSRRVYELRSSVASQDEAFAQFQNAFEKLNEALVIRWLEEFKARRARHEELIAQWLNDYPAQPIQ